MGFALSNVRIQDGIDVPVLGFSFPFLLLPPSIYTFTPRSHTNRTFVNEIILYIQPIYCKLLFELQAIHCKKDPPRNVYAYKVPFPYGVKTRTWKKILFLL